MGCCQSKAAAVKSDAEVEDLAYLAAFPGGKPPRPAPNSPGRHLDDLAPDNDDSVSESSSEELFPSDEEVTDDPDGEHVNVKKTHRLQVGVLEGTTFLNNYIVVDTLGRGAFGKVKLCLNVADDSLYAVKVVEKQLIKQVAKTRQLQGRNKFGLAKPSKASASALADLRREVDVMRALNHPNLVKLYEVIDAKEAGKLMMVMEYCEAGALVRPGQLSPERRMPEAIAQYYFRQMASGLAYLHEKGVVHGDVKPENILLSGDAVVKISDFGGSQLVGESGDDTFCQTLGTPAFLAPEICAGEDYRGRPADVWALGVSLYNFIFGELPFRGDSLMELYDSIAAAEVPFPEAVPVSIELQDLLVRTLCKDPGARITAAELMHHPWVKEEDLGALLPTLFSDEAALEGATMRLGSPTSDAGSVGGRSGASSPPLRNASTGSGMGGGNLNSPAPAYSMLRMGESMAVPAPGDVAAAVFPMLSEQAPSGAFTLGPQASIIGALMRAGGPQPKPAPVSTSRLHYLSKDSMLRKELERDDSEAGGSEAGSRPGHSRNVSELSDLPFGGSDLPDFSSTAEEGPTVGSEARGTTAGNEIAVDRSAPSAFTLMANRMTAAQAELIGRRASGPVPKTAQPAPISGPGKLDTILETSFIDDLSFSGSLGGSPSGGATASSAPAAPVDDGNLLSATSTAESNVSLIGIASDPLPSLDKATMEDAAAAATATAKASAAGGQRGGTPPRRPVLAGNIDIPRPALQRSSLGLEFSGASVAQREPSALPICSPFESDAFASMSFSAFAQQPSANSQASLHPGTTAASSAHPSGDEDSGTGNGGSVVTPEGDAQQHASEKRTALAQMLQRFSFSREQRHDDADEKSRPGSAAGQVNTQPAIKWCRFTAGQRLPSAVAGVPITYYIESGTVEIQWEAMLPVSLATVFSTALQKPNSSSLSSPPAPNLSSEQSTAYMDNMDSVAFTAPHVANMAKMFSKVGTRSRDSSDRTPTGSGRRRSVDSAGLAEANPLALTLQQATARAEALMANAAGGSLDNLLISPRGQTQFVGALIMLDPEVFADRWRMSAVAASDVVIIQMTREGLDQFLAQNPLAQVHLRSSMAMTRSEIMKLEALEKIANVHRKRMKAERKKKQQQQQGTGAAVAPSKSRSWRLADVFGIPFDEAVRMASGEVTVAPAGAKPGELTRTATLDMFALVSRLRAGAEGLMKSTTLPKTPEEGS